MFVCVYFRFALHVKKSAGGMILTYQFHGGYLGNDVHCAIENSLHGGTRCRIFQTIASCFELAMQAYETMHT